ncbi:UDP-N-acetylmuramoyl-L-alanine--D-glutamate ligase [Patulibacter defluvii]|uniref:UDP-N-acetylmuramoyl-L-alanine--D-glutamate ligase n=1 Tax=Patulibacter defluvii TaxID=3095358 RepID=UPI002A7498BA|nr:UDP-N-acetylmuramoyl-L-alanine--D-glutamate ligase [Patulibacter sp. DM4]
MPPATVPLPPADLRIGDLAGRRVGVWGAGREGAAAIRTLAAHAPGSTVVVASASAPAADAPPLPAGPDGRPPAVVVGAAGIAALAGCEVVIRSPGVPVRGADADAVRAGGATITSGTALWLAERGDRETVVAITGTKGKSTTASLLHHLLGKAGVRSVLAGNIGRPLLDQLRPADPPEAWVVELSSYQLADLPRAPTVAVVTNLMRDHLPWHGDEATYHADKLRILTAGDGPRLAVLSYADPGLRAAAERLPTVPILWVDRPDGLHVADGALRDGARLLSPLDQLPLRGATGARNVAAALEAVRALGYEIADVAGALRDFRPLPHRQQVVPSGDGRTWVDDSISTTPETALSALAAFAPGPLVLIAGGDDRHQRYDELVAALVAGRVATGAAGEPDAAIQLAGLVTLPGTGPALAAAVRAAAEAAGAALAVREVDGVDPGAVMAEAVAAARALAPAGATVLLSPAAPSHNLFRDFEDRGARFADAVAASG